MKRRGSFFIKSPDSRRVCTQHLRCWAQNTSQIQMFGYCFNSVRQGVPGCAKSLPPPNTFKVCGDVQERRMRESGAPHTTQHCLQTENGAPNCTILKRRKIIKRGVQYLHMGDAKGVPYSHPHAAQMRTLVSMPMMRVEHAPPLDAGATVNSRPRSHRSSTV